MDAATATAWFETEFATTRVMIILRGLGAERSLTLASAAWDAGIRALELPIQTDADIEALERVAGAASQRGLHVGAGTVIDPAQVSIARGAGAAFTVSPGTDEDVIQTSLDLGLPPLPGVASASDVQRCRRLGLSWMKAFPAEQLTPGWLRAMRAPFPEAAFVMTGGLHSRNVQAFLDAGARVVSFGSALVEPEELEKVAALSPR